MDLRVICWVFLLALAGGCCGQGFRSDYTWDDMAGGWLKYHEKPADWDTARMSCYNEGAVLASPLTKKLREAVVAFALLANEKYQDSSSEVEVAIHTGVHATFANGAYTTIEGIPLQRLDINWAIGEPNNLNNAERCVSVVLDNFENAFYDSRCDRRLSYVCYKKDKDIEKRYRFDYDWIQSIGGWLKYHIVPVTWDEAKSRCEAEGAVLASPTNKKLESAIEKYMKNQDSFTEVGVTILTGAKKTATGYSSREGVTFKQVVKTVQGNDNTTNCVAMKIGEANVYTQVSCGHVLPYVCYKKKTKLSHSTCGTDPKYVYSSVTGSCYKFHTNGLSWSKAFMTCNAEGGYLAIINDNAEANVIKKIFSNYSWQIIKSFYVIMINVGFHDWGHYGKDFMTIHGKSLKDNYHTWDNLQPDNKTRVESGDFGEPCGAVSFNNVKLHDNLCNVNSAFICEKSPSSLVRMDYFLYNYITTTVF